MKSRILLADDHPLFTQALKLMLDERYEVVDIVTDGKALIAASQKHKPDLIITDVTMPLMNGLDAVRCLGKDTHRPKIIFLTMHSDSDIVRDCLASGGAGFVTKDSSYSELVVAIDAVLANHTYISPNLGTTIMEQLTHPATSPTEAEQLTTRQREILQLFAEGKTMKEIATVTNLSTRTVEWHKYQMMKQLGVRRSSQLVQHAVRKKLVA